MDEVLNFDDHGDTVAFYLISLSRKDVIALGEALGLNANNLKKMKELPIEMIAAWMKMADNVFGESGEPTWSSLMEALKSIKQTALADKIKLDMGPSTNTTTTTIGTVSSTHHGSGVAEGDTVLQDGVEDDSGPLTSSGGRVEDDFNLFGGKNKGIHKPAKSRGEYKVQLRLHDEDDRTTEITPEKSDRQPYSHRGFYSMKAEKHGVALIINNKQFKEHKSRTGTDRDEKNLTETWLFLGYHVVVLRDVTRDDMARTFEKIDKLLKSAEGVANDSFVCCILSHGREGEVFGSDSKPLEYTWIQRFLAKSEVLRSRPKLLFIQACQGSSPGTEALADRLKEIDADDDRISEYTDFYLSCASVQGDRSYRDIYTGTWFITELCQTLCERSMVMDLDEIQKEVNERVVIRYNFKDYKQQPRGIDQLRKKVFFFQQ